MSLPEAVASAVAKQAEYLEKFYNENCDVLKIPIPPEELRLSTLYGYASSYVLVAVANLRSEGIVEQGFTEALQRYGEKAFAGDTPEVSLAEGHIRMNSWIKQLREDPSGFSLIDGIISGELLSQLTYSIIRPREIPYMRVIELGADIYKTFYRAVSGSNPS